MTNKQRDKYNELLLKFLRDDDFMMLLDLVSLYHQSEAIRDKQAGEIPFDNPYDRLVYDLENRERLVKE